MVKYLFKLNSKNEPDLTQKTDNLCGGICLIYSIYKIYFITLFGREITWYKQKLGVETFLRPYKKFWDKRTYRLPYVYWGKKSHPLTRHWIIKDESLSTSCKVVPKASLIHQHVKLFGNNFKSKDITSNLFAGKDRFLINVN